MKSLWKDGHEIEVIKHPQRGEEPLLEALAPDGYAWQGEMTGIHGADMADLRDRVAHTDLLPADFDGDD
jgi:hypothetical protein